MKSPPPDGVVESSVDMLDMVLVSTVDEGVENTVEFNKFDDEFDRLEFDSDEKRLSPPPPLLVDDDCDLLFVLYMLINVMRMICRLRMISDGISSIRPRIF